MWRLERPNLESPSDQGGQVGGGEQVVEVEECHHLDARVGEQEQHVHEEHGADHDQVLVAGHQVGAPFAMGVAAATDQRDDQRSKTNK